MRRALLIGVVLTVFLVLAGGAGVGYAIWRMAPNLPSLPTDPHELGIRPGTEMYAASGERIYTFNQSRQWVPLERISPYVAQALIATEDARFYHHRGVDLLAIVGAVRDNLRGGSITRGGSTLTQQLVKRLFFSPQKTLERKLSEALLTVQLEAFFAASYPDTNAAGHPAYKDRLIELYLNEVFYGTNAYGIYDAAITFFDTTPDSLSLPRAAMLIGQINAPTAYNPLRHPERATERLQHVFDRMVASGFLDPATRREYAALRAEDLVNPGYPPRNPVPYWVEAINAEIVQQWGPAALHYGSLKVYTTLDIAMQEAAEEAVTKGLVELDERLGFKPYAEASMADRPAYVQGALVCLSQTGKVLAMVGGRDIFVSYYNRALTARRQPGSGFKPIAYLAALEAGKISPVTVFNDQRRTYIVNGRKWQPRNFKDIYLGRTTAAWALVKSANATTVQISELVGPERIVETAHRLGFAGPIGAYRSIALGVAEVSVLEMAAAYGTFANYGLQVTSALIERIVDAEGQPIFTHQPQIRQAIAPDLAAQMVHLLRQTVDRGTGHRVRASGFARPAAGKTGTTNDNTDAWFTGFTPDLVASVWVGFDDRRTHKLVDTRKVQITGGSGAVPIWADFMIAVNEGRPEKDFDVPEDVTIYDVDPSTGAVSTKPNKDGAQPLSVALRRGERPN